MLDSDKGPEGSRRPSSRAEPAARAVAAARPPTPRPRPPPPSPPKPSSRRSPNRARGSRACRSSSRPNVEVVSQTEDDRYVINIGINIVIYTPYKDRDRIGRDAREVYYEELRNGRVRQTVIREDGTQVITVWNRYGEIDQRVKIRPDGTRIVHRLCRRRRDRDDWRDPGDDLPPFRLTIPVDDYVLYSRARRTRTQLDDVPRPSRRSSRPQRVYSVDEVKRSARIRDTVRRVEIGDITFDTGEATVERDQVRLADQGRRGDGAAHRREPVGGVPHRGPHRRGGHGRVQPRALRPPRRDDRRPPRPTSTASRRRT